ncbi:MAG: PDZ domain-containing protein [Chitinophagaceae bacterium]|nr:MAG: PDZ domain-containing protein [Chitinophagaceae bacterium]
MKPVIQKISFLMCVVLLTIPVSLLAQNERKEKEVKEKKEGEQIIITRKNSGDKIIVEVIGDKILLNGKEVKESDNEGDVTVRRHKVKDVWAFNNGEGLNGAWAPGSDHYRMFSMDENRAMLGVTTDQHDEGAEIESVTKESAAEKAGLQKGDVIKKVGDNKIETPDDLTEAIQAKKPGDKVSIVYLRDKKEHTVSAELGKWKGTKAFNYNFNGGENFNIDFENLMPKVRIAPRAPFSGNWTPGAPRLGVSVQDTEDGKGVNVLEVDEDGNAAKAGIKEDDIITEVEGKAVNSADEVAKLVRENKDKTSVKVKLLRKGKAETVEVKIPRKLKTADL